MTPVANDGWQVQEEKQTTAVETRPIESIAVLSEKLTPMNQAPTLQ